MLIEIFNAKEKMLIKMSFGQWLKQRRKTLDLTREALAERIGCATITIYKIETDERRPSKQIAELLAQHLSIPSSEHQGFVQFARTGSLAGESPFGTAFHPPTNLTTPPTPLIGRDSDVAAIRKRLLQSDARLLTLVGAPGIGKTRLATQVAADLLDEFTDGVFFVALAPITDAALVPTAVANTLGVPEIGPQPPLERLKTFLRDKQLLLVLDNVEQVLAAAPQIAELLAVCPLLKLLVTSRAPLKIRSERQFPVSPLSLPDLAHLPDAATLAHSAAVALFVERAQAVQPTFALTADNAATIAAICTRLDGLPLAIELISARIKLLTPTMLLERLRGQLLLQADGMSDLDPRHRTLNAAIEWSYDLLTADEQTLFRKLGIFVGGSTLEAIESICQPPMEVLAGISSLLDKNLILQSSNLDHESRFFMLETIKEYALQQLVAHDELWSIQHTATIYFLSLAQRAYAEFHHAQYRRWVAIMDAEEGNLRSCLGWLETRDFEQALYLAQSIEPFWRNRGHAAELSDRVEKLIDTHDLASVQNPFLWANMLNVSAWLAYVRGDQQILVMRAEQALRLCREIGDTKGVLWALGSLAQGAALQGHDDGAEHYCLDGLARARELKNLWFICFYLNKLGVIVRNRGDYQRAFAYHSEAAQLVRKLDDRGHKLRIFWEAGTSSLFQHDYNSAREHFLESLSLNYDPIEYAYSLEGFAGLAAAQKQPERAARLLGAAEVQREIARTPRVGLDRYFEHFMTTTRDQLEEATFDAAWAEGRAMTFDQVVAYALEA